MPGEAFALLGAMLFGVGHLAMRKAQDDGWGTHNILLSAALINELCYAIGVAYLGLTSSLPPIRIEAVAFFALAGVLTSLLGRSALVASIERIGASRAASYRVTSPLVTVTMAYLWLGERLNPSALIGAGVVMAGLWLLTRETRSRHAAQTAGGHVDRRVLIGIVLGISSAAFFGSGQVFRKLGLEITPEALVGSLIGTTVGLVVFVSAALRGGRWREMIDAHRQRLAWPILAGGLLTAGGQLSIFYAYERARVSTASVLGATEPVWTLLAVSLLMRRQEAPTWRLALSVLIICSGSALVIGSG